MAADASFRPESFTPRELAAELRYRYDRGERSFLSLLVGSGFSRSAGIPTAAEIVTELRTDDKPSLRNAGETPPGLSEYAFLMGKLGSPKDRAERVRGFVDKARDLRGRLRINWAHLLLAALAEADLIHRILTINFDPLIVEALSLAGLPIRTFDLNAAGRFQPGLLDTGSVIYLHGQMHNLLLANASGELEKVKDLYPAVLQEAISTSVLLVVGYSGECDPVLAALRKQVAFPHGLRWAHFAPSGAPPCAEVLDLLREHRDECQLCTGLDADRFMIELVLEGMKIELPPIVQRPFDAALDRIERILELPTTSGPIGANPVEGARNLLAEAKRRAEGRDTAASKPPGSESGLEQGALEIAVGAASISDDRKALERLAQQIPPNPADPLSRDLGAGFLRLADRLIQEGNLADAEEFLERAARQGVTSIDAAWMPVVWGNWAQGKALETHGDEADAFFERAGEKFAEALSMRPDMHQALNNWGLALFEQAKTKSGEPADDLFKRAGEKFAEALRIKPDKHEALNNWGLALAQQAKTKSGEPADDLFKRAGEKYAEALRIKPNKHETLSNWGLALAEQARTKSGEPADDLYKRASEKYAEALRIKPEDYMVLNNLGLALAEQAKTKSGEPAGALFERAGEKYAEALRIKPDYFPNHYNQACLAAVQGNLPLCLEHLARWAQVAPQPTRAQLDADSDFDQVRSHPDFVAFRASLPE